MPPTLADHLDLVDVLGRADRTAVRQVMTAHNECVKQTQRAALLRPVVISLR